MSTVLTLPTALSITIGFVLPLLTGLLTRSSASGTVKAVTLLALSAATSVATEALAAINAHTPFNLPAVLFAAVVTFAEAVAAHFGLWKPSTPGRWAARTGGFIGGNRDP